MDVQATFVTDAQPAEPVQPTDRAFDDPTDLAQMAAVVAVSACDAGGGADVLECLAVEVAVVGAVGVEFIEAVARGAGLALDRRDVVDQVQQLGGVVAVGGGGLGDDGGAVAIGEQVVLGAWFSAVYRAWACLFAPPTARIVALSTTARLKSIASAARSLERRQ